MHRATGPLICATLALAACNSREPVAICASQGDPASRMTVVHHTADGVQTVLVSDASADRITRITRQLDTPILEDFWLLAEPTVRALSEHDVSPCGLANTSAVTVSYDDGTADLRDTSCQGNALARLVGTIIEATDTDRPGSDPETRIFPGVIADHSTACESVP